jgi:hypothetical protein
MLRRSDPHIGPEFVRVLMHVRPDPSSTSVLHLAVVRPSLPLVRRRVGSRAPGAGNGIARQDTAVGALR